MKIIKFLPRVVAMKMKYIGGLVAALAIGTGMVYYLFLLRDQEPTDKLIARLYEGVTDRISQRERDVMEQVCGQKSPVYGEILYSSLKTILDDIKPISTDVFYDLGCGVGKVAVQALLDTELKKVVGVELSPTRAARAQHIKKQLEKEYKIPAGKELHIYKQNMLEANLDDATIVYMCSTCFPEKLMQDITAKLEEVPAENNIRILTLKQLPANDAFVISKTYQLPMTWSRETGSPVYLYERK